MVIGVETIYFIDIVGIALTKPGIIINKFYTFVLSEQQFIALMLQTFFFILISSGGALNNF
jgi:hypothetical protein